MAILQTCVLTLFACIYTALHLNVPAKTDFLSTLITKTKWVLMALFAPEIVLYMAADQLVQALRLKRELKTLQANDNQADKKFDFSLRYVFFVVMGGVRIAPEELAKFGYRRRTSESVAEDLSTHLTPSGVIELARRGYWIYIKSERIAAKSQANLLQKALVLLQVLYMATTCIARRAYGLPLTLLEIHTMVHVICAIALYGLWLELSPQYHDLFGCGHRVIELTRLKKPLDISEAEVVYDAKWDGALARFI
ncbi:hypothetical protein NEMBOFW57_006668 [Staphylotrichum longicolle]|uniref:Uncharacterized protein n=1 Tax=Staphylotrichum longicolle TaxID=669026 RepID=A0AAD4HZS2_9PEZI|nr:hypothetical protein NEMBOFW57_006668 [Staphylotrichum longicolle]